MEEDSKEHSNENKEAHEHKEHEHQVKAEAKAETKKHHHAQDHGASFKFKIKKVMIWQALSVILAIFLIVSVTRGSCNGAATASIESDDASAKAINFINTALLDGTRTAVLHNTTQESNLYKITFDVDGQEYPSYISTDGKLLFLQQAIDMDQAAAAPSQPEAPQDIPKAEKPKVELFVMSHCPYGTQIEKGMLPVVQLLGDKIDFQLKFVYYAMHGQAELDEQMRQHCMQKEFPDKFIDYLICFLGEGKGEQCADDSGADKAKLDACIASTDEEFSVTEGFNDQATWLNGRFPLFNVDKELNDKYGVGGSPQLVINGASANSGRDSASLLKAVCGSFTTEPSECSTELSSASPAPGFGFEGTGDATTASCE